MIQLPRPTDYLDWKIWATELIRRLDVNDPVRDVAKALIAGDDITAEYDPQKKTIRLSAGISDEVIDDRVAALLQAGANITLTYNDVGNTLTIAASSGATDLDYTASTRVLTSSTGADVTLPLFSSSEPGLVAASGGGTSNFLRADGSWAAPGGGGSLDIRDEGSTIFGGSGFINFVGSGVDADSVSGGVDVKILGDGRQHVKPILSDFTWFNQGSASATQRDYGISLRSPLDTGYQIRGLVKTAPSTPYEIRTRLRVLYRGGKNYMLAGLVWRDGSGGGIQMFSVLSEAAFTEQAIGVQNATNATTFSSTLYVERWKSIPEWLRLKDDGTTRYFDISPDGDEWVTVYSQARTTFITPTQVGFAVNAYNAAAMNWPALLSLLSWEQL